MILQWNSNECSTNFREDYYKQELGIKQLVLCSILVTSDPFTLHVAEK